MEIRFTIDDKAAADTIVGALLAERLVACGQRIGPIISRYRWAGSIEEAEEWLVLLKTRSELIDRVIDVIVEHHPYETPEVVALPIVAGYAAYLDWIDDVTGEVGARDGSVAPSEDAR
ncbi:MAG: divalent-cation tolerance protein CutA [Acidimicrobiales bacterium]